MELPKRDDPIVYWLLEAARRIDEPDEASERIDEAWQGIDSELEDAIRAAATGEWDEEELYTAFMEAMIEAGDEFVPLHERLDWDEYRE